MAKRVNIGRVRGTDGKINSIPSVVMNGADNINIAQSGGTVTISAPTYPAHANNTSNPHSVTKAQIGLSNVDNKSEATIITDAKTNIMTSANINSALGFTPASTTAIDAKQNKITGNAGQILSFDSQGNATPVDMLDPVYGFEIDVNESNPSSKVRYLGINAGYASAKMNYTTKVFDYGDWADAWFIKDIKPRIIASDGSIVEELDPTDYTKTIDGDDSSIYDDTIDGNVMIGIPTVWFKIDTSITNKIRIYVASYPVDNMYHAYAHTDVNGNIMDYTYIAAYNGWDQFVDGTTAHKLRSISGKIPTRSQTGTNQIAYCRANNPSGETMWDMHTISDRELISMLCILVGKSTNTQDVFGGGNNYGYYNKATAAMIHTAIPGYPADGLGADENGVIPTGTMDTCGLFWGTNANNLGVKIFGIENLWGNIYDRTQGLVSVNGHIKAKLTRGTFDGTTVSDYNTTGEGYIEIGVPTGGTDGAEHQNNYYEGYISQMKANQYGLFMGNLSNGSASTHYCDYGYNIKSGTGFGRGGGGSANSAGVGILSYLLITGVSVLDWYIGARLSLKCPTN